MTHDEFRGGTDGPLVFGAPTTDQEAALISGTFALRSDCLVVETPVGADQEEIHVLVLPHGSAWLGDSALLPSGERLRPGDAVELAGGVHDLRNVAHFVTEPDAMQVLQGCLAEFPGSVLFVAQ